MPLAIGGAIGSILQTGLSSAVTSAFAPGGIFGGGGFFPTGGGTSYTPTAGTLPAPSSSTAITTVNGAGSTWPRWLVQILLDYGPAVAQSLWTEFQRRRRSGESTAEAGAAIRRAYPNLPGWAHYGIGGKRRRMNPANVKALRRAVRRVRSFRKLTRKVRGVFPTRTTWAPAPRRRRRVYARGDLDPDYTAEDLADLSDEAEDLGYEPDSFREGGDLE